MTKKLWIVLQKPDKTFKPTKVSTDGCLDIDDFQNKIHDTLCIPTNIEFTLYKPDGITELNRTDTLESIGSAGEDVKSALIVKWNGILTRPSKKLKIKEKFMPCPLPFYSSMFNVQEEGDWLSFVENIPETNINRLFIRDSYRFIASNTKPGINKMIITGTPGIGKSLFLIYLLWKLVRKQKRVLFIYHPRTIYYDGKGNVFSCPKNSLPEDYETDFWSNDLWCLFDCKQKQERDLGDFPYSSCSFVVTTSPKRGMVHDFKKPPLCDIYYMPIWTEKELVPISSCYPNNIDWRSKFNFLGGIPRKLFEEVVRDPTKILRKACTKCSLDDCLEEINLDSEISKDSKIIHSLIHIHSAEPYEEPHARYASETAVDILAEEKSKTAEIHLKYFLIPSKGKPLFGQVRGKMFESHALNIVSEGGTFNYKELVNQSSEIIPEKNLITLLKKEKKTVEKVSADQTANHLYIPRSMNYPGIDAWIPGFGAFQVTIDPTHTLKEIVKKDLKLLGPGADKIYWVLPPEIFATFTKRSLETIQQYAIQVPIANHFEKLKETTRP